MSIDTSSSRRSPSSDMSDLQSEYTKKKKKYAQEQEEQLSDLKDYYNQRKEDVRDQGEAAVNHIRKTQSDSVTAAQEARHHTAERSEAQIAAMDEDYRKKVTQTQSQRQAQLDELRSSSHEKMHQVEQNQQDKIQKIREDSNHEIKVVKDKSNEDLKHTEEFTNQQLTTMKENSEKSIHTELGQEKIKEDKLNQSLTKEYNNVNTHGQQRIQQRHDVLDQQYDRQEKDYNQRFHAQTDDWNHREKDTNDEYQNRINHNKRAYEQQLKDQNYRFQSVYGKNDAANRESLNIQEGNYLKEQIEMKKKFFKSQEHYAGKENDPFYKLQDRGSRLRENPDFYILEAYVPEHEKDNIQVSIHDDKAAITGRRAFKDEVKDEDHRLTTNSYQSFREEFNFDKPIITQGMTRERSGDYVTFWVPKLNSFDQVPRLSRKA